jgi:site-specific DNA-methyltransferase (adenine-specific)
LLKPIELFVNQVTCGDCVTVLPSLPDESIDLVVTDPPYLVRYKPRDGRSVANDDNSRWLAPAFAQIARVLKPNAFCATFYGWPWIDQFMEVWKRSGLRPVSHLTWVKSHCSREGYTQSYHEVGFLLAKGKPPRPARPLRDVLPWEYTGNELHPNQKPVIGITPLIEAYSNAGDIVLDPFAGSGTTAIAARGSGRQFILIETVEQLCRVARNRINNPLKR